MHLSRARGPHGSSMWWLTILLRSSSCVGFLAEWTRADDLSEGFVRWSMNAEVESPGASQGRVGVNGVDVTENWIYVAETVNKPVDYRINRWNSPTVGVVSAASGGGVNTRGWLDVAPQRIDQLPQLPHGKYSFRWKARRDIVWAWSPYRWGTMNRGRFQ